MCWIHELSVDIWICKGQVSVPYIDEWIHGYVRLSMYPWVYICIHRCIEDTDGYYLCM